MAAFIEAWYPAYDAAVSDFVFSTLQRAGFSEMVAGRANTVIGSLPLVSSPTPMVTMILGYLVIVAFGLAVIKLRGKRAAQGEDPLLLRLFVQVRFALSTGRDHSPGWTWLHQHRQWRCWGLRPAKLAPLLAAGAQPHPDSPQRRDGGLLGVLGGSGPLQLLGQRL